MDTLLKEIINLLTLNLTPEKLKLFFLHEHSLATLSFFLLIFVYPLIMYLILPYMSSKHFPIPKILRQKLHKNRPKIRIILLIAIILHFILLIYKLDNVFAILTLAAGAFFFRDLIASIFMNLYILLDSPFSLGDKIQVDGYYGRVTHMGFTSVKIVTDEDSLVSIPNKKIYDSIIYNTSFQKQEALVVVDLFLPVVLNKVKIDYTHIKKIALEAAATSAYVSLKNISRPEWQVDEDSPYFYVGETIIVEITDQLADHPNTRIRIKALVIDTRLEELFKDDVTRRIKNELENLNWI